MTFAKNLPASLSKIWKPMWLTSLGLHGLLLVIPIPTTETPKQVEKPQELVKLTPVTPAPTPVKKVIKTKPTPVATRRPPTLQQKILATRQTAPTVAKSPSPVVASPPPKPAPKPTPITNSSSTPKPTPITINSFPPEAEIELDPKSQELLPLPQVVPSVSPSPITIATEAINGVPVDPNWQAVEQPKEVIAEAEMFTQPDGKLHPDIVGKVAQIPDKDPNTVFEEFFRIQLAIANFTVEPTGTYAENGGLYKLTPKDNSSPLYLALAPNKQGTGTVVTIWNKFPNPIEPTEN